jgi:hypothetical protein
MKVLNCNMVVIKLSYDNFLPTDFRRHCGYEETDLCSNIAKPPVIFIDEEENVLIRRSLGMMELDRRGLE